MLGFVHLPEGPPPPAEISHSLPQLGDREVSETLRLGEGYAAVRSALLAVSGISLMESLALADEAALAGVVVTARQQVDHARESLAGPSQSRHPGVRRRAQLVAAAADRLEEELASYSRDGHHPVPVAALRAVRGLLAQGALPEAGMRRFTSVSCAGYDPDARGHDHGHGAEHSHSHSHAHSH